MFPLKQSLEEHPASCNDPQQSFDHYRRRSAETCTRFSLCGVILIYTKIKNLFLRCQSHRASAGLSKGWTINANNQNCN